MKFTALSVAASVLAARAEAQLTARNNVDGSAAQALEEGDRVLQEEEVGDLGSLSMSIGLLEGEGWWGDGWWSKSSKASGDWWSKSSKSSGWWGGESEQMGWGEWDGSSGKAGKAGHQCSVEDMVGTFVTDIIPYQFPIGFKGEPRPAYITLGYPPAKDGLKDPEGVMWALLSSPPYTCEKYIVVQTGFSTGGVLPFFATMPDCHEECAVLVGEYDCKSGKMMIGRPGLFDGSALAAPYPAVRASWLSGEEMCEPS